MNRVYLDVTALPVSRENKDQLVHLERLVPQVCRDPLECPDPKERADLVETLAHQEHKDHPDLKVEEEQLAHKVCEETLEQLVNRETEVRKVIKVSVVSKVFQDPQEKKVMPVFLDLLDPLVLEEKLDLVVLLVMMVALVPLVPSDLPVLVVNLVLTV